VLGEHQHERVCSGNQGGDIDDTRHSSGAGVGHRHSRARHTGQPVSEVLAALDERRSALSQRGADPVRARALLAVIETRGDQDVVESRAKRSIRDTTVDNVTMLISQHEARFGTGEVITDLFEHGRRRALETRLLLDIGVIGRFEPLWLEADQGRPAPRRDNLGSNRAERRQRR
jgi:hypothetical protein